MGNSNSLKQNFSQDDIRGMSHETGFSLGQLNNLYLRFQKLDVGKKDYLQREDLLSLPELNVNPLSDRIIHAFFSSNQNVRDPEKLKFQDFVRVLAIFRPISPKVENNKVNTLQDKLLFSFRMYDIDGDGQISKDELMAVLTMLVDGMEQRELNLIAERFIQEIDKSNDDLISADEFLRVMDKCGAECKMSMKFRG